MSDNPLAKILNTGLSFFKRSQVKGESVLGVDIGSSSIKIVQLKKRGGLAVLETYGELSLGPYAETDAGTLTNLPTDKLAEALREMIKDAEVTATEAAVSIPAPASLVFTIELPAELAERELSQVVPTESRKYIPVPINEVSLDWWVVPKKEETEPSFAEAAETEAKSSKSVATGSKTEVLVAAIHNDTIARYRDILKSAGLSVDTFEIEIWSSIRSTFGHEVSAVMLVDIGASKTKLAIVDRGIVRTFHVVNRGSVDISNGIATALGVPFARAEELKRTTGLLGEGGDKNISDIALLSVNYILGEANSVVLNYEKKYNKVISKVVLTGGGSLLKGLPERAAANFRTDVVLGAPFEKTETPAFLGNILKSIGPEFAVATGLALRKLK